MSEWKDWLPLDTLRELAKHVIGNLAVLMSLWLIHIGVDWFATTEPLRSIILRADEFMAVAVVIHLFAHFAAHLWKNWPKFHVVFCT